MPIPAEFVVTGKPLPRLHASPTCLDRLKERETGGVWDGQRLRLLPMGTPALAAYPDDAGVWTIGWGATGPGIKSGVRWTILECEVRFESDILTREAELRADLRGAVKCTVKQFEAMLSLVYNIGDASFDASTLLKLHRAGDYEKAAEEFLRWDKITVDGRKVQARGLTKRRTEERAVYLGGDWRLGE